MLGWVGLKTIVYPINWYGGRDSNPYCTDFKSVASYLLRYHRINIFVKTYDRRTPQGLHFHLSLYEGVCCIIVYDIYDYSIDIKYFNNVNAALRYINSY